MESPAIPPPANPELCCGTVSLVGRPNVGKSTLLNRLIGEKVAIVSKVPQTTRMQIRGIYTDERGQIIFIDTPGLLKGKDRLDCLLNKASLDTIDSVDALVHLVDTSEPIGPEEEMIVDHLREAKVPVILGLNKIDLKGKFVPQYFELWEKAKGRPIAEVPSLILLPLSGKTGIHVEELRKELFRLLPKGPPLYPTDVISDTPQKMVIADIIREKLLFVLREEVPHSLAVAVEKMEPRKNKLLFIQALILVERESQKEIVIGKGGQMLKKIGTQARQELEELMERTIFLELQVKLEKNWRQDSEILHDLGYEL